MSSFARHFIIQVAKGIVKALALTENAMAAYVILNHVGPLHVEDEPGVLTLVCPNVSCLKIS